MIHTTQQRSNTALNNSSDTDQNPGSQNLCICRVSGLHGKRKTFKMVQRKKKTFRTITLTQGKIRSLAFTLSPEQRVEGMPTET
mmetsp:Transcript_79180/g.132667  ORF Transcript_79180/g.132667 Transcript_79180/m.132667 type:complete len:84 (+) Transcript_79180:289-540(+)